MLLTKGAVPLAKHVAGHEEWIRMDTGQENLTKTEKENQNCTPPKCRAAHPPVLFYLDKWL